jgi:hypothetical protein
MYGEKMSCKQIEQELGLLSPNKTKADDQKKEVGYLNG